MKRRTKISMGGGKKQSILIRTPEAANFLEAAIADRQLSTSPDPSFSSGTGSIVWSSAGAHFVTFAENALTVHNGKSRKQEAKLEAPGIHAVAFSPKGTFLITFQRPSKEAGNADKNLKLWDWRTGEVKLQLFQKSFSRDNWPTLQLTADESLVLHAVNNAVNAYETHNASAGVARKLGLKGLGGFAVSPSSSDEVLAAFVPEGKGIPGFIGLWKLRELGKSPDSPAPYCRRSFFRATSARLLWNAKGTAVLALTASETDASNKSYYGEQKLHFLAANGSNDSLVPLPKEGPVHDVQWSPSGDHFVTVSGFMPARTNLFSSRCRMLQDLGAGPHNLVRWNPQGRFLAVAGFGNLPGDIGFYEKQDNDTCTPLGAAKAEDGVTMDWSPDGRHLLTATTAPRMRVNNGIQIFRYSGELLEEKKFKVLLEAVWQPAGPGEFEDRPASPRKGSAAAGPASAAPIRSAGYVPPHQRTSAGASTSGGHFSLAREETASSKLTTGPKIRGVVPGAEPEPASAAAKKPRKRSKGKGKAGDAAGGTEPDGQLEEPGPSTNGTASAADTAAEGIAELSVSQAGSNDAAAEPAKRVRNLQKKLKQIQQLREKIKAGGKGKIEPEQEAKLASEQGIIEELRSLGEPV